jgi:phosphohistidine phosphatase
MAAEGVQPDVVVVSSAARARSTASEVLAGLALTTEPQTRVLDALYQVDPYELLSICALEIPVPAATAVVIGHNPTIAGAGQLIQPETERVDVDFPTAAFAVFGLEVEWADLRPGVGSLLHAYAPHG